MLVRARKLFFEFCIFKRVFLFFRLLRGGGEVLAVYFI